ncbi:MAG: formamidopyrimidine-DNA glycosylase [Gammaproteobacteria bacterium]|nr:formamidopyrimidine-DNA glycosylase [Gammaproteobacteria bacterium]
MPELPDITLYIEALEARLIGEELQSVSLRSPFLLRTVEPRPQDLLNKPVTTCHRVGKRIAIGVDDQYWLVIHLMIAGRLHWYDKGRKIPATSSLLQIDFPGGSLTLTEAGSKKRASVHILEGIDSLTELDPQGLEVLEADCTTFARRLTQRNHTLKRALTSPSLFSGIGNAYSDEILHRARLSPVSLTQSLSDEEIVRLFDATQEVLTTWLDRLRRENSGKFPKKVTAFREGMAVHGKYNQPCPVCQTRVQRIRYVGRETNYCPRCQTNGKVLADRALSRLLKSDWPRTIEELEQKS